MRLAGLALVLAGATAGCTAGDPTPTPAATTVSTTPTAASTPTPSSTSTPTSTVAPAFVVATYDSSQTDGGMQAELRGTGVVQNGCFFLRLDDPDANGPDLVLLVFPDQRVRIEDSRTHFNEELLREGDRIKLGGGYVRSSAGADRPTGCRGERIVFMVGDY